MLHREQPRRDRISASDAMVLATDTGPAPMNMGVVLILEDADALDLAAVREVLSPRVGRVPRLRMRLHDMSFGVGRPVWVDDPHFILENHLTGVDVSHAATAEEGERRLLDLAAGLLCTPLDRRRPLWSALFVTGLPDGRRGLVIVLHHVLADGIGGLAILEALADAPGTPTHADPSPVVAMTTGATTTARSPEAPTSRPRSSAARSLRSTLHGLRELGLGDAKPELAVRTRLNRPTGSRRRLTSVAVDLPPVIDAAHRVGATVNDVVLAAVFGALHGYLAACGEPASWLVASVPISSRSSSRAEAVPGPGKTAPADLGNATGVVPVRVPPISDRVARVRTIAALTAPRRVGPVDSRGSSAAPLAVAFRTLGRLGLFQFFVNRQRLVNTFVTNVRGPARPFDFGGCRVAALVPMGAVSGNVALAFAVLSYAGRLRVTLIADPDVVADQDDLTMRLGAELAGLVKVPTPTVSA